MRKQATGKKRKIYAEILRLLPVTVLRFTHTQPTIGVSQGPGVICFLSMCAYLIVVCVFISILDTNAVTMI